MYFHLSNLLVFSVVAVGFVVMNVAVLARLLRPKSTFEPGKVAIYECGEPTIGQAWIRFDIRFYTVALMFVIFDVEVALLFPWAAVYRDFVASGLGVLALVEAGTFIAILMVGLAYVWIRGDIDWRRAHVVKKPIDEERRGVHFPEESRPDEAAAARKEPAAAGAGGDRA